MAGKHVHAGAIYAIGFIATLYAVNFLARTWAAHHSENPAVQGLIYGL